MPYHSGHFSEQSISVIMNSSGAVNLLVITWVELCTKLTNLTLKSVFITECSVITEFVITDFHCILILSLIQVHNSFFIVFQVITYGSFFCKVSLNEKLRLSSYKNLIKMLGA